MYNLIAPSFFQKKSCRLPGIGQLTLMTHSAETDFLNSSIKAPYQEIVFLPEHGDEKVFNEFSAISEMMKRKLTEDGILAVDGMGDFTVNKDGAFFFEAIKPADFFYSSVVAERVIRKDAQHDILVGNTSSNSVLMTEYFNEDAPVSKDLWWMWAIVLGFVGLALLGFYIYKNGIGHLGNAVVL